MTSNTTRTRKHSFTLTLDSSGRREARLLLGPASHTPGVRLDPDGTQTASVTGKLATRRACDFLDGKSTIEAAAEVTPCKPDAYVKLKPRWDAGEYSTIADLDSAIMNDLGCSHRRATAIRHSWGIRGGARGAILTGSPS